MRSDASGAEPATATAVAGATTATQPPVAPPLKLDRSIFSSSSFSAPVLINALCQRVLSQAPTITAPLQRAGGRGDDETPQQIYQNLAGKLASALEDAQAQIEALVTAEHSIVREAESDAREVESAKKALLNQVRVALGEGTSQRIRGIEDAIANALTSTIGIEQHLNQANARVSRGRVVSSLLKYFHMFTHLEPTQLTTMLASLSKAREEQRARITDGWANGEVSTFDPRFYTTRTRTQRSKAQKAKSDDDADEEDESDSEVEDDDSDSDDELPPAETATVASAKVPLHRFEAAVVAQGLDRLFASRYYTEAQVPWIIKLRVLSRELMQVATNAVNVLTFMEWLKEELEDDCTHLMECFRALYDANPDTASHLPYGRTLLKTLELSGKLYGTLCAAESTVAGGDTDAASGGRSAKDGANELLDHVIDKAVEDMAADVRRHHAPKRVPDQPPLPEITMTSMLQFYLNTSKPSIEALGEFLEHHIKREVLVVEAVVAGCMGGRSDRTGQYQEDAAGSRPHHVRSSSGSAFDDASTRHLRSMSGSASFHPQAAPSVVHAASSLSDVGGRQARQRLFERVVNTVLKRYVSESNATAVDLQQSLVAQEGRLTPRSRRRSAGRVADAMAFAHSMTAGLFALCDHVLKFLDEEYGSADALPIHAAIPALFPTQEAYVSERHEVTLLKRYFTQIEEEYMRALLVPVGADEPYDVVPEHAKKANDMLQRLDEVVSRVFTLCPPHDVGLYVADLASLAIDTMGAYLLSEAEKMMRTIKDERTSWNKKPKSGEDAWIHPSPRERHLCAARMVAFIQVAIMKLHDCITGFGMRGQMSATTVESLLDLTTRDTYAKLDDCVEGLVNLIAAAVVTKGLIILYYAQDRHDYQPKGDGSGSSKRKGKGGEELMVVVRPSSRACGLFCQYVSYQLKHLVPLLSSSCGQLWLSSDAYDSSSHPPSSPRAASASASQAPSHHAMGGQFSATSGTTEEQDRTLTSLPSKQEAILKVRRMTLQQLLFGDGGPSSLVRAIGVPLYRGIVAHVRGFRCNEAGALIYKQDMAEYCRALLPLTEMNGLDALIVARLCCLLRESTGLLLAAVENIRAVKGSGLLGELMSNEEKVAFLRMREDLRAGFSAGW